MKPNGREKRRNGSNPCEKSPPPNFKPDKEPLKEEPSNDNGSPLKILREEKGISQRALARKLGIEKTRVIRAESKPWGDLSMTEIEIFSQALGVKALDLFLRFNGFGKDGISRSGPNQPYFVIDYREGVRIASYVRKPQLYFKGSLMLAPHKGLSQDDAPRCDVISFYPLHGELLITVASTPFRIREGESFSLEGGLPYELYNSHQFKEVETLLFTLPSFIRTSI